MRTEIRKVFIDYMGVLLSSTPPHFNKSVQHKRATPFQPPKSLGSTPKPLSSTYSSDQHQKPLSSTQKNCQKIAPHKRAFGC